MSRSSGIRGDFPEVRVSYASPLCPHCSPPPTVRAVCTTTPPTRTRRPTRGLHRCSGTRYAERVHLNVRSSTSQSGVAQAVAAPANPASRPLGRVREVPFCIRESRGGRLRQGREPRDLADGSLAAACAKACPTTAIVFGDLNDPNSRAARLARSPRGTKLLEDLGAEPKVTYLSKQPWHEADAY